MYNSTLKTSLAADMVVLSACDTSRGEEVKGEGLMSLTNGFLQVGAKSVISSHWKIDDNASKQLMSDFYEIIGSENVAPSKALQKAKIRMFKNSEYKSPFYWSAFTIHGDFQNRVSLKRSFDYRTYGLGLLIGILAWGVIKSRRTFNTAESRS